MHDQDNVMDDTEELAALVLALSPEAKLELAYELWTEEQRRHGTTASLSERQELALAIGHVALKELGISE